MSFPSRSPPPHADRSGFSRSGFAPIPHRHDGLPLPPIPPPPIERDNRDWADRGRGGRSGWGERMDEVYDERSFDRRDPRDDRDRRAPPPRWEDDYERKRRRSPSPFASSHRQRHHSPPPFQSALLDPAELPNQLSFRQFADWFRASHPQTAKADEEELRRHREALEAGQEGVAQGRVGMAKRYERYRKEYTSRQLYTLFLTHRDSPWFLERYAQDPRYVALRRRVNRQGRVPTAEKYLDALRAGQYDQVSFEMSDDHGEKKSTGSRRLSDLEEPEGLDRALGDLPPVDDYLRVEVPPAERQVFVKTVPPSTGRKDLEKLFSQVEGFQYLALTEPAVKKALHRVAWAQFADGVNVEDVVRQIDGQKIDTFTFHMGVNSTPVVGKTRLTPPISNSLERLEKDGANAKILALKLEGDLVGFDDEDAGTEDKPESSSGNEEEKEGKQTEKEVSLPGLREPGTSIVQEKIDRLLEGAGLLGDSLDEEQKLRRAKLILDHWLSYLRYGLSTCYYCVASMSFPEELHRKCISHKRPHPSTSQDLSAIEELGEKRPEEAEKRDEDDEERRDDEDQTAPVAAAAKHRKENTREKGYQKTPDEKWEENLDTKIAPFLGDVDVVEYGGRDPEEETKKLCNPLIKQEEESKYRCKECSKLFKAPEFVQKHVLTKHGEHIKPKLDEISTLNAFVLDPQKLQPTLQVLASVNDQLPAIPVLSSFPSQLAPGTTPLFNPAFGTQQSSSFNGHSNGLNGMNGAGGQMNAMQQTQMMMMMQMQQAMMMGMGMPNFNAGQPGGGGRGGGALADRMGGFADAPPAGNGRTGAGAGSGDGGVGVPGGEGGGGTEDPRARRGRVSYQDLDEPGGGGDGGLPY